MDGRGTESDVPYDVANKEIRVQGGTKLAEMRLSVQYPPAFRK
jgi:hypothetical protein